MRVRRFLSAGVVCLMLGFVFVGSSGAVVPRTGMGLGIADDDAIGSVSMPPASLSTSRFDLLRPKTFRFQIYWDAVDDPNSTTDFIDKARAQVARVRAAGVQQVVATFKEHGAVPTVAQYEIGIRRVVEALAPQVDVWGPANEPNGGDSWLPGLAGARKLAAFNASLAEVVGVWDSGALRTSPDFIDRCDPQVPTHCELASRDGWVNLRDYVEEYLDANGDWGHYAAIHAYGGIRHRTRATIDDFAGLVPAGKEIWITEVGGFGRGQSLDDGFEVGNQRINWMLNGEPGKPGLASHSRVARIYHYHMKSGGPTADWDTALLNSDLSPRPAWYTWCAATHGDNTNHSDCAAPAPPYRIAVARADGTTWVKEGWPGASWALAGHGNATDVEGDGNRLVSIDGVGATWLRMGLPGGGWQMIGSGNAKDVEIDGNRVAVLTNTGDIWLKDGLPGGTWQEVAPSSFAGRDIELSGDRLVVARGDGTTWIREGLPGGTWVLAGHGNVSDVELDGNRIASVAGDGSTWFRAGLPGGAWSMIGHANATDVAFGGDDLVVRTTSGETWHKDNLPVGAWSLIGHANARKVEVLNDRAAILLDDGSVWLKEGLPGGPWQMVAGPAFGGTDISLF